MAPKNTRHQHQPVMPVTELTHVELHKHLLVQRNLSCISKSSCERFGKVWHCDFCLVNEFAGGQAFGCVFLKNSPSQKLTLWEHILNGDAKILATCSRTPKYRSGGLMQNIENWAFRFRPNFQKFTFLFGWHPGCGKKCKICSDGHIRPQIIQFVWIVLSGLKNTAQLT